MKTDEAKQRVREILDSEDFPGGPVVQDGAAVTLADGRRMVGYREMDGSPWMCVTDGVSRVWRRQ